jgi:glycosyltransferase involved in cell wall biosynthesis
VQDGVNGRIVPVGEAAALADAMGSLLDDAAWRALAGAARPSVARFAWPQLVDRVEFELRSIAAARPDARRER